MKQLLPWKSNKYYIFLCGVRVCAHACACLRVYAWVLMHDRWHVLPRL
jgi:hypothetical protein